MPPPIPRRPARKPVQAPKHSRAATISQDTNTLPAELLICGYMIPAQKVLDGREGREKKKTLWFPATLPEPKGQGGRGWSGKRSGQRVPAALSALELNGLARMHRLGTLEPCGETSQGKAIIRKATCFQRPFGESLHKDCTELAFECRIQSFVALHAKRSNARNRCFINRHLTESAGNGVKSNL